MASEFMVLSVLFKRMPVAERFQFQSVGVMNTYFI